MCTQGGESMPNMKNAEKRLLVNAKKEKTNNNYDATMKSSIKKVEKAVIAKDKDTAKASLKTAIKAIDKATSNGVSSKNKSARNKSRLTKSVNSME